jgi:imidazoleglycerol-phosphate dehydratase
MRISEIHRTTRETDILIRLDLDGTGEAVLNYPAGFMAHMLETFARHGLFDLTVQGRGDLQVDNHHLFEDTGIVLGQCFAQALGEKRGIHRAGFCLFPMDETLSRAAVDLSGRPFLVFEVPLVSEAMNAIEDFWHGFVTGAACTLHLDILRGRSDHHKVESLFKAAARALREAVSLDPRAIESIPSTKGVLV